jgi:hypothetical protein
MAKILTLSLFESNSISRRFRRNQEGGDSGSVTIMETGFSAGLRQKPNPGVVGLAGLGRVRVR